MHLDFVDVAQRGDSENESIKVRSPLSVSVPPSSLLVIVMLAIVQLMHHEHHIDPRFQTPFLSSSSLLVRF